MKFKIETSFETQIYKGFYKSLPANGMKNHFWLLNLFSSLILVYCKHYTDKNILDKSY